MYTESAYYIYLNVSIVWMANVSYVAIDIKVE